MKLISIFLWSIGLLLSISASLWALVGETAGFRRGLDVEGTTVVVLGIIPLTILVIVGFYVKHKMAHGHKATLAVLIIVSLLGIQTLISTELFKIDTPRYLADYTFLDEVQLTPDGKYKYSIQIVNPSRRDRQTDVIFEEVRTRDRVSIPLNLFATRNDVGFSSGFGPWSSIDMAGREGQYVLTITTAIRAAAAGWQYLISVSDGTAVRIR